MGLAKKFSLAEYSIGELGVEYLRKLVASLRKALKDLAKWPDRLDL